MTADCMKSLRMMAILSQLSIVAGMILIGWWHFENIRLGIAAAVLYLLLPYTALMTGRVDHALPGALIIWAVATYRQPLIAGRTDRLSDRHDLLSSFSPATVVWLLLGTRGPQIRGWCGAVAASTDLRPLVDVAGCGRLHWAVASDVWLGFPNEVSLEGFWSLPANDAVFRLPVLAAFIAMIATLAIWPVPKNLGTLLSCTAAVLLGSQFWKAHNGGLFMAWFLPVLLLVIFRPNLENRVALLVLDAEWFPKRRQPGSALADKTA